MGGRHSVEIVRFQNKFDKLTAQDDIESTLKSAMKDWDEVKVPRTIVVNLQKEDAKNKKESSEEAAEKAPELFKTSLQNLSGLPTSNRGQLLRRRRLEAESKIVQNTERIHEAPKPSIPLNNAYLGRLRPRTAKKELEATSEVKNNPKFGAFKAAQSAAERTNTDDKKSTSSSSKDAKKTSEIAPNLDETTRSGTSRKWQRVEVPESDDRAVAFRARPVKRLGR
jgi:hypothetical protein